MNAAELLAAEICLFEAWRAPDIVTIGGWRVRSAADGYRRLNSAWTAQFDESLDLDQAIARTEAYYAERKRPSRFMVLATAQPAGLDAELERRGYAAVSPTLTLAAPVRGSAMPDDVVLTVDPTAAWLQLYDPSVSAERRIELGDTFARMPRQRLFATGMFNGRPASTAVGAFVDSAVAVECVFTAEAARGKGIAGKVLAALDAWAAQLGARHLLLAVAAENASGRRLYEKAGYRQISSYHYREKA